CVITVYVGLRERFSYYMSTACYLHILVINMIYFTATSITIARFYCLKFSHSEDKIMQYSKKLEALASVDALTGLFNRRHMNKHLEELERDYFNASQPFSIVIGDIDFFKKINDTYGHDAGDYVLTEISKLFLRFMKGKGEVARWGGEEFLFSFEGDNADFVFVELHNLRTLIKSHEFKYKDTLIQVTVTFGLEEYDSGIGLENTITRADAKLYTGKVEGRDRVVY
ncbi:MAG: GGDEF domain-containing protein, partial [Clostridia bacterium]|nr:GGDEF domain-containing protein [Clostridia bacterium]